MEKILFFFPRILRVWQLLVRKLKGITGDDIHDDRIISGKLREEFCDRLKSAGAVLKYQGTLKDPFNHAEGMRYLARLTRAGLEAYLEYNDPSFPVFRRTVHETVKMGADNPDNFYFNAQISGLYEYRIKGKRNTVHYLGFFTQNGNYGTTGGLAPCGSLEHYSIQYEPDGSIKIVAAHHYPGLPNHIETCGHNEGTMLWRW